MEFDYRQAMRLSSQLCFPLYAAARGRAGGGGFADSGGPSPSGAGQGHPPAGGGLHRSAGGKGPAAVRPPL